MAHVYANFLWFKCEKCRLDGTDVNPPCIRMIPVCTKEPKTYQEINTKYGQGGKDNQFSSAHLAGNVCLAGNHTAEWKLVSFVDINSFALTNGDLLRHTDDTKEFNRFAEIDINEE